MAGRTVAPAVVNRRETIAQWRRGVCRRLRISSFAKLPAIRKPLTIFCKSARNLHVAREQRKLAAIVTADVVGYPRLMGRDESGTLARLREHRKKRLEPALARYGVRFQGKSEHDVD
jgi:class 3 adenylate cyclase